MVLTVFDREYEVRGPSTVLVVVVVVVVLVLVVLVVLVIVIYLKKPSNLVYSCKIWEHNFPF